MTPVLREGPFKPRQLRRSAIYGCIPGREALSFATAKQQKMDRILTNVTGQHNTSRLLPFYPFFCYLAVAFKAVRLPTLKIKRNPKILIGATALRQAGHYLAPWVLCNAQKGNLVHTKGVEGR